MGETEIILAVASGLGIIWFIVKMIIIVKPEKPKDKKDRKK